jgi:transposase-like protein
MQRIHPCALTPEDYAAGQKHLEVEAEEKCPRCGARRRLHRHGSYERGVTTVAGIVLAILVARFRCADCRGTISYLPSFALSYRVVQAGTVEAYLDGQRGRADVERWLEVLVNYARRMSAFGGELLEVVGGGFGRGPPEQTPLWAWLREACGSLEAATRRLVTQHKITLFKRYQCHQPPTAE